MPDAPLDRPFVIETLPGFTPRIGQLAAMMRYVRMTTLRAVEGLDVEQLDHLLDENANSIGMLLEHIACVEEEYQVDTFGWDASVLDSDRWRAGADLGLAARRLIRGQPLDAYLERLADVRQRTLDELSRRDDAWLEEESTWWDGRVANNHFKWFHVFEDEVNHRGQIRLLRKRLP